jgi:hypothetical protein
MGFLAVIGHLLLRRPTSIFCLYTVEQFSVYDGWMVVGNIVLWELACVLDSLVIEQVHTVGFLRDNIALIFLVTENLLNGGMPPFAFLTG